MKITMKHPPITRYITEPFMWNGILWDITPEGQEAIIWAAFRASLYGSRQQSQPAAIKLPDGELQYLDARQVSQLALALLDYLNNQNFPAAY